jgi:hypothetical protein
MTSSRIAALAAFFSMPLAVFAQSSGGGPPPGGAHRPPPEAIAACQGKSVGTAASFTGRDGRTISGPCTQMGDVVAVPPPRRARGASGPQDGLPPPDAQ